MARIGENSHSLRSPTVAARLFFRSHFSPPEPRNVFDHIEKLKREFTDKYVVVDATRPELARFAEQTGQVKTVNMNGRALVQFELWNNIAWYDIELDFLKVVPRPEPRPAGEKAENKPAAKAAAPKAAPAATAKKLSPLEMARQQGAAKAAGTAPAAKAAPAAKPVAAKPAAAAGGKMSTSDILAAARAKKASEAGAESAEAPVAAVPPAKTLPLATPVAAAAKPKAAAGPAPTNTAEKIAWCRAHDAH